MTQRKQKNKRNILWILVIVVVLLLAGVGGYFAMNALNGEKENKEETSEYEEKKEQEKYNENSKKSEETEEEVVVEGKEIIQYEGADANDSEVLTGVVTYAAVSGDNLMIRVSIDQYLSNGTCGLTLSRGGDIIYSSIANIVGIASTSTCEGFDVPISELGGGAIKININLNDGERSGELRGEVNI